MYSVCSSRVSDDLCINFVSILGEIDSTIKIHEFTYHDFQMIGFSQLVGVLDARDRDTTIIETIVSKIPFMFKMDIIQVRVHFL